MARVVASAGMLVLVVLCGCRPTPPNPPPVVANSAVVGKWAVASIDGKPLPPGTEINVEYKADGKVSVEKTGDSPEVPALDTEELKLAMDQVTAPQATLLRKLEVAAGANKLELKWNGGERDAPKRPVPPKK